MVNIKRCIMYAGRQVIQVFEINNGFFRVADDASGPGIVPLLSGQVRGANGQPLWVDPFGENSAEFQQCKRNASSGGSRTSGGSWGGYSSGGGGHK